VEVRHRSTLDDVAAEEGDDAFRASLLFQELERITNEEQPSYFESRAKRQHFVPQLMLREFSREVGGKHYLYQLDVRSGAPRRVKVEDAASRRYYYAVTNEDGTRNNRIEGFLAVVEGHAAPALQRLLAAPEDFAPGDRATLSFFFALLDPRTPGGHEKSETVSNASMRMLMATDFADSEAFVNKYRHELEDRPHAEIEAFRDRTLRMLETGELGFADPRARALELSIRTSADIAEVIHQMSWTLLRAERGFITSDRALAMFDPSLQLPWESEAWASSPNAEVSIPITEDVCLVLHFDDAAPTVAEAEQDDVARLNLRTYGWARDYVFGATQDDVALVRRIAKRRPRDVPRQREKHQVLIFEADPQDTTIADANVRRGWPRYLKTDGVLHDYFVIGPRDNAATISARVTRMVQERAARAIGLPPGTRPPGRADTVPVDPFDMS
jgi:uncharacterized protein DUF4238